MEEALRGVFLKSGEGPSRLKFIKFILNNKLDASASFFIGEGGGAVDARLKKCDGSIKKGGLSIKKRAGF